MERLHSKIIGEGQNIVILHGFLGMSDNWKSVGSRYAENGFEVHLVDQRNHGRSFWSEDFSYRIMAEDLRVYLNENSIDSTFLLGHSMGGKTAMQFACTYPEMVEKLIVADIAPKYYPPHHQEIINGLLQVPRDSIESRSQADEILKGYIKDMGIRQFLLKSLYWAEKGRLDYRFNLDVLQYQQETVGQALPDNAIFEAPTLFIRGQQSDYILDEDIDLISEHFTNARLETVERAGHWLHAENPGVFISKTLEFIKS